jgi:signal transduction histidine kinase
MDDGADDFLVKPVSLKALLSCVEARLNRASISWRVEDKMLTQLLSSVPAQLPHEFFTPLVGIIGLMEIVRGNSAGFTAAEVDDIHNDVYKSAIQLHRTLKNYLLILDLQTASTDPVPPALSPREVEEAIRAGVDEVLRSKERREDITVRVSACSVSVAPEDLRRMVEEVTDNACKFSRQGTPVGVELSADGRLTITDEGRGLTAEEIGRIGAFQQFDRKKHEQQGLGLGLVLVQKLKARCNAKFSITSKPGQGTQVQIAFPLAVPA